MGVLGGSTTARMKIKLYLYLCRGVHVYACVFIIHPCPLPPFLGLFLVHRPCLNVAGVRADNPVHVAQVSLTQPAVSSARSSALLDYIIITYSVDPFR